MGDMTAPSSILFFAAGLGTRMGPLVADRPKPLVSIAGQTLLDRTITLADIPQIERRVVNVHYKAEMIRDHLDGRGIEISDETDLLRETGGGLRHALPLLGNGSVFTMNTDAIWSGTNPVSQLLGAWRPDMGALLMLVPRAQVKGHKGPGDFQLQNDGRLKRGPGDVYSGLQIIHPEILNDVSETCFSMNIVWDKLMKSGSLYGTQYTGEWCDVGQPESIPIATQMLAQSADV